MPAQRFFIEYLLMFSALITASLAVVAWRRRVKSGRPAALFAFCMVAVTIYSFGYAMELNGTQLDHTLFWLKVEHLGIQAVSPLLLLFALSLTGREKYLRFRLMAPLFIIPALYLGALHLDFWRSLIYLHPRLVMQGPFAVFTFEKGPLYWLNIFNISLCLAIATVLFLMMVIKSARPFRRQAALLLTGSLIPWMGMAWYVFGHPPYGLDISPIALSLSGLISALAILRFRLLEIAPLAREFIFEGLGDGMLILDRRNLVVDYNPTLQVMLPEIGRDSIGLPIAIALASYPGLLGLIGDNSPETRELQIIKEGRTDYYQCRLAPLLDGRRRTIGRILSLHDYRETKSLLDQFERLARLDELTGVYNRRYFREMALIEMGRAKRERSQLSLIVLDLDHFKNINDTYGHAAGDLVLRQVARTCLGLTRKSDLFGRLGGEEFTMLLPETDPDAAAGLAERLRAAIERERVKFEGQELAITASFGVSGGEVLADLTLDELFRRADKSLYEAKDAGRNRVVVWK